MVPVLKTQEIRIGNVFGTSTILRALRFKDLTKYA